MRLVVESLLTVATMEGSNVTRELPCLCENLCRPYGTRINFPLTQYSAIPPQFAQKQRDLGTPVRLRAGLSSSAPTALVSWPLYSAANTKLQFSRRHWRPLAEIEKVGRTRFLRRAKSAFSPSHPRLP